MNMRSVFRAVAVIASVALLVLLVGCSTPADPHADHNHSEDAPAVTAHDHDEPALTGLKYEKASDGSWTLIISDCEDTVLIEKKGLDKHAMSKEIAPGIIELAWLINNNPGGYECLYVNRMTCQVSDVIVGEQVTDGTRIVYTELKDGKVNVTVRDLFNSNGYNKVTVIDDAYTAGEYAVLGAVMHGENQVNVSYRTDKDGGHAVAIVNLYEEGEKKPTETTKKTEKK